MMPTRHHWRNVIACSLAILLGNALVAGVASGQQLPPPNSCQPNDSKAKRVAFTASGGISAGAYQAGVTWAVVELMKLANRDIAWRESVGASTYYLTAAAGASAGNINAITIAAAWADSAGSTNPEKSLFWELWTRVGIQELRPTLRDPLDTISTEGLFSRRFVEDTLYPKLSAATTSLSLVSCRVPVGLTLTSVQTQKRRVLGAIDVDVQRFVLATVFNSAQAASARFEQPDSSFRADSSVGAVVVPDTPLGSFGSEKLLPFIAASAAFPIAFSPVELSYRNAEDLLQDGTCPRQNSGSCRAPRRALFADGGLFDSNPIALALDLTRNYSTSKNASHLQVIFTNPGLLRSPENQPQYAEVPGGVGASLTYLRSAIPAARQYELFSLDRRRSGDAMCGGINDARRRNPPGDCVTITPTLRSSTIYGGFLGNFAAFLGRPLREHDFYAGVADGMMTFFESLACDPAKDPRFSTGASRQRCLEDGVIAAAGGRLQIGAVGQRVLSPILRRQFGDGKTIVPSIAQGWYDSSRVAILGPISDVTARFAARANRPPCEMPDLVRKALCDDGLDSLLSVLRTPAVLERIEAEADRCPDNTAAGKGVCFVDGVFLRLSEDPVVALDSVARVLLQQLDRVEAHEKSARRANFSTLTSLATVLFESTGEARRRGFYFDPSTSALRPTSPVRSALRIAIPYTVGFGINRSGFMSSWRPTYYTSKPLAVIFPVGINWALVNRASTNVRLWEAHASLGLLYRRSAIGITSFDLSAGAAFPLSIGSAVREGHDAAIRIGRDTALFPLGYRVRTDATYDIGVTMAAGRLRVGWRGYAFRSTTVRSPGVATLSLSDANGLLYWILGPIRNGIY